MATLEWLFKPDFSKVGPDTLLAAIGQAFFSIALAAAMTYGSYSPERLHYPGGYHGCVCRYAGGAVALVGVPAVFHFGLDIASGAGLIFQTLPVAFAQMPGGHVFAVLFFVMLSVAGITSMVGLLESATAWCSERFNLHRHMSSVVVVVSVTLCRPPACRQHSLV